MILCGNPKAQFDAHRAQILEAIARVCENGRYIHGEEVKAFESEFAQYLEIGHAFGVANGTDALHVALRACGVGPGDEVITVAHTAVATVAAIELSGATPVVVDIEPGFFTLDPNKLLAACNERTKAIIPVHIYGQSVALNEILAIAKAKKLRVIEDCAQAHGARLNGQRLGTFGDVACFSFYPTKNLGAIGDGGAVVTNDDALAERIKLIREYGWRERYISDIAGFNSRLDELQAAVLRIKLRTLDEDNSRRDKIAHRYDEALSELPITLPKRRPSASHVFHLYVIQTQQRDALMKFLQEHDIAPLIHYPVPVHLQPAYKGRIRERSLPVTEQAAHEILSLPLYPELADREVQTVIEAVRSFFSR